MNREQLASKLMDEGFRLLDEHDLSGAMRVGKRLRASRHSSGFEIIALAFLKKDQRARAIQVLEEGVRVACGVWILWELLGNCYSDSGKFARAERAYQRALTCANCSADIVHLNRGIAFLRAGKPRAAQEAVSLVRSRELSKQADALMIRVLLKLSRQSEALLMAEKLARCNRQKTDYGDPGTEAETRLACAAAFHSNGLTRRALRMVQRAICLKPSNSEALALIRNIRNRRSKQSRLFHVMAGGRWHCPFIGHRSAPGFFRTCQVVAPDEQRALEYMRELEPPQVRDSLWVEEIEILKKTPTWLEGLYYASGRGFYPWRSKK